MIPSPGKGGKMPRVPGLLPAGPQGRRPRPGVPDGRHFIRPLGAQGDA